MEPDLKLQTLFEAPSQASFLPLPEALDHLYGSLAFDGRSDGPLVIGNFVSTLDGVISLESGQSGGAAISGNNGQDMLVMGLLRAVADVVMEGAGTLRASPKAILTAQHVYPEQGPAYAELRQRLGKPQVPLNVIVSESGELDMGLRLFQSGEVPVLILTSAQGASQLAKLGLPPKVQVKVVEGADKLEGAGLVHALGMQAGQILLVEGGPQLLGSLIKAKQLHQLFLTLAPQVAGRAEGSSRPGFVSGQTFAPEDPRWGELVGVKKGHSHLFLRYAFPEQSSAD